MFKRPADVMEKKMAVAESNMLTADGSLIPRRRWCVEKIVAGSLSLQQLRVHMELKLLV